MALSIKKQGINFAIDQGCSFSKTFTAKNANNANVTVTVGSMSAKMTKSYDTANTSLKLSFTTSTEGSNVSITATATQTGTMAAGRYYYDVEWTHDTTEIERIVEGIITLSPQATS
jgi:hypothetical protein